MRLLNQDPLENFFGLVRQEGGDSDNPTVEQFDAAFKTILITRFSTLNIRGTNCCKDESHMLLKTNDLFAKLNAASNFDKIDQGITNSGAEMTPPMWSDRQVFSPPRLQLKEQSRLDDELECESWVAAKTVEHFYKSKFRRCGKCTSCITATGAILHYTYEASSELKSTIAVATRVFKDGGDDRLCSRRMTDINLQKMMIECDFGWVSCPDHGSQLIQLLLLFIILINAKKRCNEIINESARRSENATANRQKILQQASRAKW